MCIRDRTMIVPKGDCIPDEVSCGLDTVGIRLPSHPMARALIHESGCLLYTSRCV